MKLIVLSSSRADYGIYYPLLKKLRSDPFFELQIIAFGSHLSIDHGETIHEIIYDGFKIIKSISPSIKVKYPKDISKEISYVIHEFTDVWTQIDVDLIIALGDRYEMFAACVASIPFNIPIAHIHGGETTKGAFDEIFRGSLSLMANYHFPSTIKYANRIKNIIGSSKNIFTVGALSIDNLKNETLYNIETIKKLFGFNLLTPTVLVTFHPETKNHKSNRNYIKELLEAIKENKDYNYLITFPNMDTYGKVIKEEIILFSKNHSNINCIESLGRVGYLSCLKYCEFVLGNSSSVFVEASYFSKYVINIGDRQKGRIRTKNIYDCKINKKEIIRAIKNFKNYQVFNDESIYGNGNTAYEIIENLKKI